MNAIRSLLCAAFVLASGALCAEPLRLIFAGDVMLDDGPGRVIAFGRDPLAPCGERGDTRIRMCRNP